MQKENIPQSIVMIGATGAVGTQTLNTLLQRTDIHRLSLLGRRPVEGVSADFVQQATIDIFDPTTYDGLLIGHDTAICTLGVGEPSKMSKEDFIRIDKDAVLDFAKACKAANVQQFHLLSSVGANAKSANYYLRAKGELIEVLEALGFQRLSVYQPSMILTPENRYGVVQGIFLAVWPWLNIVFQGGWKKYRGIEVAQLGQAIANNAFRTGTGTNLLEWADFQRLTED